MGEKEIRQRRLTGEQLNDICIMDNEDYIFDTQFTSLPEDLKKRILTLPSPFFVDSELENYHQLQEAYEKINAEIYEAIMSGNELRIITAIENAEKFAKENKEKWMRQLL